MHETCTLAQFVAQTQFTDVPASLVDDCNIMVLDTLGAGFVGAMQPWAQRAVEIGQGWWGWDWLTPTS